MTIGTTIPIRLATITPQNKCGFCTNSKCCTYLTQQIDTPRAKEDFDLLLWQISHRDVEVYKDSDGWFLLINNKCTHLQPGGRCGIYETRPQICRDYSNDYCEFDEPAEKSFDLYFKNYDDLLRYCKARFKSWEQRLNK
jgi:Fe-S-cluster containining protein